MRYREHLASVTVHENERGAVHQPYVQASKRWNSSGEEHMETALEGKEKWSAETEALSQEGWEMVHEHCKGVGSAHMEKLLWRLVQSEDDHTARLLWQWVRVDHRVMLPLRWVPVGHRVMLRGQSDLGHLDKTRRLGGVRSEKWYMQLVGDMGKQHDCMGRILRLGSHWGSDMAPLAMNTCCLLGGRK